MSTVTMTLGGKPNPGTSPDRRLKKNRGKGAPAEDKMMMSDDTPAAGTDAPNDASSPQWRGVLIPEGSATGDGREFSLGSLSWAQPPLPLRWQKEGSHGGDHDVTVQVGLITKVWRDGDNIMGEGHFDLGGPETDDAHEAFRRMNSGTCTGISIDADDIDQADIEYVFPETDGNETEDDDVLFMLFQRPDKVIFHSARIRAATLCDIPAFIEANLKLIQPEEALSASAVVISEPEPDGFVEHEALVAHAWHDEWRPPHAWFSDPKLGQVMPIMINDQGRVYGHAAQWGQCHLGYMGECVMPPFEASHDYYCTGEVVADDGKHVAVGTIIAGIEHAKLTAGSAAAKQHYDNTSAVVAYVVTGNDRHGIWVAGAVRPDASATLVQALRGSGQVSPDWRRIGGALRMVGLLTVNVSGYQTPKARSLVAGGEVQTLIASGMVSVRIPQPWDMDREERERLLQMRADLADRVHGKG